VTIGVAIMSEFGNRTGIAATAKYNPHLWSADELRAIFVARQRELATILDVLRAAAPHVAPQHLLITGQRGMGKSTLLQRVALAVEDDAGLSQTWLPLRFPEEQYTVSTPAELWSNVIGALGDAQERNGQPTTEVDAELTQLMQLPKEQREEAGLTWLNQWCKSHQQRLLLLIDSTDFLFANLAGGDANKRGSNQDGGASALWRVRKALLHSPHFLWLGGSYQPLEVHGLYSDAFLDFFQLIELRPLTLAEMQTAIQAMARVFGAGRGLLGDEAEAEIKRALTTRPERLRAMRQLTGGNPRTTVMLYELFAAGGRDNVRADLERLLDAMTPLYKARLEVLADQSRKVLAHVMEHWAPVTAKALARAASLPVGSISAQLTRLEQEGLIEKTPLSGTKRFGYQSSERFFNIWYLMRNAARGARARVGWLVEFMRLWYSSDELQGLARTRRNKHREGLYCDGPELEYSRAIVYAMPKDTQESHQLDWAVFQQARKGAGFCDLYELDGADANYSSHHNYLERLNALRSALVLTPLPEEDKKAWVNEVSGALHLTLVEKEALAADCVNASLTKITETRSALAERREQLIATYDQESIEQVETAVTGGQFFPECPDATMALTQMLACFESNPTAFVVALRRFSNRCSGPEVEVACKKAIELAPNSAHAWDCLGDLLSDDPSRCVEAEAAYRKAIEFAPDWAMPWKDLGILLGKMPSRLKEAELACRKALELDPSSVTSWGLLGTLLNYSTTRYEEAEVAYRKAIELDPKWTSIWLSFADLLGDRLNRFDEAELAYRKAIELDPKSERSWGSLGDLLAYKLNRNEDAEVAYRKAIEISPKSVALLMALGYLLSERLSSPEDAKAVYHQAIELDSKLALPWGALGDLLRDKLHRHDEAAVAYRRAIELDPKWAAPWHDLGILLNHEFSRHAEAEVAYRKAIELAPKWAQPWDALGDLLSEKVNQHGEAEAAYRKAIELDPKSAWPWIGLGQVLCEKLHRHEEAEVAYRNAIKLDPKSVWAWINLGELLQDRLQRYEQAEMAYRQAMQCDQLNPLPVANLARLLARLKRNDEANELFRQALKLVEEDDHNIRLQAHSWLGNNDLAMQALNTLAELASQGKGSAFYELKEQCFECHAIGLSKSLVALMERSSFADFLQPFALALRVASGEKDVLLDVAVEVRGMTEDVVTQINGSR
jgi:tetratricopeptide (TPR) repeat protein